MISMSQGSHDLKDKGTEKTHLFNYIYSTVKPRHLRHAVAPVENSTPGGKKSARPEPSSRSEPPAAGAEGLHRPAPSDSRSSSRSGQRSPDLALAAAAIEGGIFRRARAQEQGKNRSASVLEMSTTATKTEDRTFSEAGRLDKPRPKSSFVESAKDRLRAACNLSARSLDRLEGNGKQHEREKQNSSASVPAQDGPRLRLLLTDDSDNDDGYCGLVPQTDDKGPDLPPRNARLTAQPYCPQPAPSASSLTTLPIISVGAVFGELQLREKRDRLKEAPDLQFGEKEKQQQYRQTGSADVASRASVVSLAEAEASSRNFKLPTMLKKAGDKDTCRTVQQTATCPRTQSGDLIDTRTGSFASIKQIAISWNGSDEAKLDANVSLLAEGTESMYCNPWDSKVTVPQQGDRTSRSTSIDRSIIDESNYTRIDRKSFTAAVELRDAIGVLRSCSACLQPSYRLTLMQCFHLLCPSCIVTTRHERVRCGVCCAEQAKPQDGVNSLAEMFPGLFGLLPKPGRMLLVGHVPDEKKEEQEIDGVEMISMTVTKAESKSSLLYSESQTTDSENNPSDTTTSSRTSADAMQNKTDASIQEIRRSIEKEETLKDSESAVAEKYHYQNTVTLTDTLNSDLDQSLDHSVCKLKGNAPEESPGQSETEHSVLAAKTETLNDDSGQPEEEGDAERDPEDTSREDKGGDSNRLLVNTNSQSVHRLSTSKDAATDTDISPSPAVTAEEQSATRLETAWSAEGSVETPPTAREEVRVVVMSSDGLSTCGACRDVAEIHHACVTCGGVPLCDNCRSAHLNLLVTRCHEMVNVTSSSPSLTPISILSHHQPLCSRHGQDLALQCCTCAVFLCHRCLVPEHSRHDVRELGSLHPATRKQFITLQRSIKQYILSTKTTQRVLEEELAKAARARLELTEAARSWERRLTEWLSLQVLQLESQVAATCQRRLKELGLQQQHVRRVKREGEMLRGVLAAVREDTPHLTSLILNHTCQARFDRLRRSCSLHAEEADEAVFCENVVLETELGKESSLGTVHSLATRVSDATLRLQTSFNIGGEASSLACTPYGEVVCVSTPRSTCQVWDPRHGLLLCDVSRHVTRPYDVQVTPSGQLALLGLYEAPGTAAGAQGVGSDTPSTSLSGSCSSLNRSSACATSGCRSGGSLACLTFVSPAGSLLCRLGPLPGDARDRLTRVCCLSDTCIVISDEAQRTCTLFALSKPPTKAGKPSLQAMRTVRHLTLLNNPRQLARHPNGCWIVNENGCHLRAVGPDDNVTTLLGEDEPELVPQPSFPPPSTSTAKRLSRSSTWSVSGSSSSINSSRGSSKRLLSSVCCDTRGRVWAADAAKNGLYVATLGARAPDPRSERYFLPLRDLTSASGFVTAMTVDAANRVIVGTSDGKIYVLTLGEDGGK